MLQFFENEKKLTLLAEWKPRCWIDAQNPTMDEINYLVNNLKIPKELMMVIQDVDERSRIIKEDGWVLVTLRTPHKKPNEKLPFGTTPIGVIFKDDIILILCFEKSDIITNFISKIKLDTSEIRNEYELILHIALYTAYSFLNYLKKINLLINNTEDELEESVKNQELHVLLHISRCLVYFITALKNNHSIVHRINHIASVDEGLVEIVDNEIAQALETANVYNDILSSLMDAYASIISNNLNVIMKQLTAISIILMIPTLIASLYGMNVPNNFQNNPLGFLIIIIGAFGISSFIGILFRRNKWY